MRFALDSSRVDFASSLDSMLRDADVPKVSRALAAGDVAPIRTLWKSLSDTGITGLLIGAEFDGSDAEPLDMVVALERMGKWAVPGPVVESLVAVPSLLRCVDTHNPERRRTWLHGLCSGQLIATLAFDPAMPFAIDPAVADLVLSVSADAVSTASIVSVHDSIDPTRKVGEVGVVHDTAEDATGFTGDIRAARAATELLATLGIASQLLGAGQAMLDSSAEYVTSRRQFGRVIGSFQAVKHQLADVMIGLELARPLLYNAALSVAADSPTLQRDVSAAKIACGDAAYRSSRVALQVHGAIGYTSEYDLSLWITKVRALQSAWGTAAVHRQRVLEAL
ncbi:acyl-CoA dehydrogenase [Rhodococcus sp. G-MC3]|uniref:acyl-CoA dehydrogenase family protein n=1 Tax=Rhodococcus sp. G-MC3 TaxID=3046209 RepID=UPI0024BB4C3E|nr:acyl-CoA dehydrogenase [Rhodococcus sp. G-MC3]MDJ0394153.1 acyl-CoA dehydrogenase [Rhodococcus sp. G-MC3]